MNKMPPVLRYLLAAASAALLIFSFEPFRLWPLAWFAFVPLLLAALDCPDAKSAANLGGFAGLVFYGVSVGWLSKIFGAVAFAFWCIFALWLALHVYLLWKLWNDRLLAENPGARALAFVLGAGALWVGLEYFRCEVWWLECCWLALGFSQGPAPALLQAASLAGVYGLSALVMCFNAALVLLLKERRYAPAAALALLVAVLAFWGAARARSYPAERGKKISVALVQDETFNLELLTSLSLGEEAKGADLVIWPEYSFPIAPGQDGKYLEMLAGKLKASKSVFMIGGAVHTDAKKKNRAKNFAWLVSGDGKSYGRYDKLHPIPYVEKHLKPTPKSLVPNPSPEPVKTPLGLLGVQICYDLDFENGSRIMARKGAQLLAVNNLDPADWGEWQHRQHSAMAPFRAAETGLWIVRAASSGWSQVIDPAGRVRVSLGMDKTGVLAGEAYLAEAKTVYTGFGWLLAPACFIIALLAVAVCLYPVRLLP